MENKSFDYDISLFVHQNPLRNFEHIVKYTYIKKNSCVLNHILIIFIFFIIYHSVDMSSSWFVICLHPNNMSCILLDVEVFKSKSMIAKPFI